MVSFSGDLSGYPIDDVDEEIGEKSRQSRESSSTRSRGYPDEDRDFPPATSRGVGRAGGGGGGGKPPPSARSEDEEEPVPPPVIKNPRKQSVPPDDKDQVIAA